MKFKSVFSRKTISFFALLCISVLSFSQKNEGNIVQYFGKEKVEEVNEGSIIHLFKTGLILRKPGFDFNSPSVLSDPLLARILTDGKYDISEGKTEQWPGGVLTWEQIEVGDKNDFNDPGLRSGYLYLEYESPEAITVLFEASGHTSALINGLPHEGDHYDFGWQLIPLRLKKGKNEFVLTGGRFPTMRARLLKANAPVQFTQRDMTLPDLLQENREPLWGAIRVMNTQENEYKGGSIVCKVGKEELTTTLPDVAPMYIRKLPFLIPNPAGLSDQDTVITVLLLKDNKGKTLAIDTIELAVKSTFKHHKRTFISDIDGSVQYYSIAPSSNKNIENPALFFSVHGASVEAVNQANAYQQKDWGHLVAPTNRRPFGFAWEDWGRLDALEVLTHSEKLLKTDPQHTYLTGHSMGGHGTWYLGATYPDRFAAIAPCAGYPDLLGYRQSFVERMKDRPEAEFARFGMTKAEFLAMAMDHRFDNEKDILLDSIIRRAGTPSRTLKLERNYLHFGVFVLHGEIDNVVPTFIARMMRERLGKFHNDFTYYEYPGGTHWYGDHSVDWPPIFDFFKARSIKAPKDINKIEFYTGSPGVSSSSHFIHILQQMKPFDISTFDFRREEAAIILSTTNVQTVAIDIEKMATQADTLSIDGQEMPIASTDKMIYLTNQNGSWKKTPKPSLKEKGPHRNGGFKDAFRNNMVFVYASKGSKEENEWYYNRAKVDAEKFWYRANGNVELIRDTEFTLADYPDRNVILYGNKDNNVAWDQLLSHCPVQVSRNEVKIGTKTLTGDQWGSYFIYPRQDSDQASIGVVTATGIKGMKGAYANDYLVNGTTFPDLMLFDHTMMKAGISGVKCSGFLGNDWSVEKGDFVWR
ncbi:MAG: alpha/beta hydrolase [Saprospiraceae bacterium]|nr:alpha/beta hydrolase [Saprospiraceae bacterium]MCB9325392.1 alpha/beta hydrolase [Lewinellaceae bacterium]